MTIAEKSVLVFVGVFLIGVIVTLYCTFPAPYRLTTIDNPTYKYGDCVIANGFYSNATYGIIQDYQRNYYLHDGEKPDVLYSVQFYVVSGIFISKGTKVDLRESQLTPCKEDK